MGLPQYSDFFWGVGRRLKQYVSTTRQYQAAIERLRTGPFERLQGISVGRS